MLLDYIKNDIKEGKLKLFTEEIEYFENRWKRKPKIRKLHYLVGGGEVRRVSKKVVKEVEELLAEN